MKGKAANPNTVTNMTLVNAKSQSKAASLIQKIGKGKRKAKVELSKGNMKYLGKLVKEMKKQMLPYEKQAGNVFTFLNYLEKEAQSKSKRITLMLSFEELDFLKMQVKESTKAVEELRLTLKWYNLAKKFIYGLLVKQNKYFLEELTK
ncbi:MAG: viral A-type inclusion protein [Sebaldella sp.]|nr:viral A-type inclusion protein [Sebaldella sp.]